MLLAFRAPLHRATMDDNPIQWWHWIVLGLSLSMAEMLIPSFFVIWFGLGALIVGGLLFFIPSLSLAFQVITWAILATLLVVFWFRYLKPRTISSVGTSSANVIGEVGILISDLCPNTRGHVRFQKPILGSDQWECFADDNIKLGERVRIVSVEGNYIKVEKSK